MFPNDRLEKHHNRSGTLDNLKSAKPKVAKKINVTSTRKSAKVRTVNPALEESNPLQTSSDVKEPSSAVLDVAIPSTSADSYVAIPSTSARSDAAIPSTSAGSYAAIPSTSAGSSTPQNKISSGLAKKKALKKGRKKKTNVSRKLPSPLEDDLPGEPDPLYNISSDDESSPPVRDRGPPWFTPRFPQKYKRPDLSKHKFYHNRLRKDGTWIFNKQLLKYFLTPDGPDYEDLKNKRFNTSFLHEKRRGPRDIQIYTPEELKIPVVPLPEIKVNVTDGAPGEKYKDVFKNLPISPVDLDEDIKKMKAKYKKLKKERKEMKKSTGPAIKTQRSGRVRRKVRKPVSDEALGPFDYEKLFDSTEMFKHESIMDMETLLSTFNTPSSEKSVGPQEIESEDSYRITHSQEKKLRNDPRKYDWINELSDKGRLLSKEELLVNQYELGSCNGKRKPKSVAGCNENKKAKSRARCNEKKLKSTAEAKEKRKPKSRAECNGNKKATSGCPKKKSRSVTTQRNKQLHAVTLLPHEQAIDNLVLRISLDKLAIKE